MVESLESTLHRQAAFSRATFGPGQRTSGVLDHLNKESKEVLNATSEEDRAGEWIDMVILSWDGALRQLQHMYPNYSLQEIAAIASYKYRQKLEKNELRKWPNWRTQDPNKAIEHVKGVHD